MGETCQARAKVKGRVQGVFYRQTTKDKADALGLSGWVRNEDDGSVMWEAVGSRDAIESLIAWCRMGPPSARVDDVLVEWMEFASGRPEKPGFQILRDY